MIADILVFLIKAIVLTLIGTFWGKYSISVFINGEDEQYDTFYTGILFILSLFVVFICSL